MSTEKVCFVVEGEFITEHARALWKEGKPDRALRLLETLQGMTQAQMLDVLEGRARLTGDSSTGIGLEIDTEAQGTMTTLVDMMKQQREETDQARDEVADLVQMAIGDTVKMASPTGLREVPRRKTKSHSHFGTPAFIDGYGWEDNLQEGDKPIKVYRQCSDEVLVGGLRLPPRTQEAKRKTKVDKKVDALTEIANRFREAMTPAKEEAMRAAARAALSVQDTITKDTGWLSPEGKFYPCRYMEHVYVADLLGGSEADFEVSGWVKLCMHAGKQQFWGFFKRGGVQAVPTEVQLKLVAEYCQKQGIDLPYWAQPEEKA